MKLSKKDKDLILELIKDYDLDRESDFYVGDHVQIKQSGILKIMRKQEFDVSFWVEVASPQYCALTGYLAERKDTTGERVQIGSTASASASLNDCSGYLLENAEARLRSRLVLRSLGIYGSVFGFEENLEKGDPVKAIENKY